MKNVIRGLFFVGVFIMTFTSCKKETETFSTASLQEFFPLKIGKKWIYRIDSIVPATFGVALLTKTYHAKDTVVSTFNDNQGRLSYVIFRYIRDTAGKQPWTFGTTIHATPTAKWVEYVENNLRYIKISLPITEGYSWYGHAFIDTRNTNYTYLDKLNGWEYTWQNVNQSYRVLNKTYDSTATIAQNDETTPPGPFDPNNFKQRTFGKEVYAKGVGLIHKDFLYWTWQTTPPPAKFQDDSYGIRLDLISTN